MTGFSKEKIDKLAIRRHPQYKDMKPHWDFLYETYRGGRAWFDKHIFKYMKESKSEFEERKKRAYRFNHTREVVDLVNKYVWRCGKVVRSQDAPEEIKRFWRRSRRNGWSIEKMMPTLSKGSSIYGRIWAVVDATKALGEIKSVEDEKRADYRTFFYWKRPQDMLDVAYDDDGNIIWIMFAEKARHDSDPFGDTKEVDRIRIWTQTDWYLFELGGSIDEPKSTSKDPSRLIEEGSHNLGVVPVFPVDHQISDEEYSSQSLIDDIAYLDRAVANYLSNLDAIIQDQTFSQLAMPAQSSLFQEHMSVDDETGDEEARKKMQEVGTKRVFLYDSEGGEPMFLSPDPKQASLITDVVQQIINEIYHCIGMAGERTKQDNAMGIDNSSGVAKAFDFERVNSLLISKGQSLEWAENKLIEIVLRYHDKWDEKYIDEPLVKYPENYDVIGAQDELQLSARYEMITTPLKLRQYQLKRAVNKLYQGAPQKEIKELQEAIDEMEDALEKFEKSSGLGEEVKSSLPNQQNQDDESQESDQLEDE